MKQEEWRKFGEIQYIRGRLDELFKLDKFIDLDMSSCRKFDARISKYLIKFEKLDPMAYELYRIERENIKHTIKRNIDDT
jgi:hypothetical protein